MAQPPKPEAVSGGSFAARHPYACGAAAMTAFFLAGVASSNAGLTFFMLLLNAGGLAAGWVVGRQRVDSAQTLVKEAFKFIGLLALLSVGWGFAAIALFPQEKDAALWLFVAPMYVIGSAPLTAAGLAAGWKLRRSSQNS